MIETLYNKVKSEPTTANKTALRKAINAVVLSKNEIDETLVNAMFDEFIIENSGGWRKKTNIVGVYQIAPFYFIEPTQAQKIKVIMDKLGKSNFYIDDSIQSVVKHFTYEKGSDFEKEFNCDIKDVVYMSHTYTNRPQTNNVVIVDICIVTDARFRELKVTGSLNV